MAGRLVRRLAAGTTMSALVLASVGGSAAPAQAGLLDSLLGTVTSVTTATTDLVSGTLESLLGPTGWIVDDGVTELSHVASVIGADRLYSRGVTGKGVGVALVDTGVVPVKGLTSGNVVNGPDLSFESQSPGPPVPGHLRPRHAHGRHHRRQGPETAWRQRLPGHRAGRHADQLKVAAADGAVDVSQVIAAIDWVVAHRNDDPAQPDPGAQPLVRHGRRAGLPPDPLTHAVENAWRAGIVVVVAGGNGGTDNPRLNNPAYDPYVIAVGASDTAQHGRRHRRHGAVVQQPR